MKKILIPTDFTVDSLLLLRKALDTCTDSKVDIILVYGAHLTSAISDLLYYSKKRHIENLANTEFNEGKAILINKYKERINSLTIDLFIGATQSAFNSFIEGLNITTIYTPSTSKKLLINKNTGFHLDEYFSNSKIEIVPLEYEISSSQARNGLLSKLLAS